MLSANVLIEPGFSCGFLARLFAPCRSLEKLTNGFRGSSPSARASIESPFRDVSEVVFANLVQSVTMGDSEMATLDLLTLSLAHETLGGGHRSELRAGQGKLGEELLMIRTLTRSLAGLAILFTASSLQAATVSLETFDAGKNGFDANTISATVIHQAAGGNPGGHLLIRKDLSPPAFDVGAMTTTRAEFLGNYAAAGITGASVDLNFQTEGIDAAWIRFRRDGSSNGWRHSLTNVFPLNSWNTYSVDFDPNWTDAQASAAGWLTDQDVDPAANASPAFADVLKSVGFAEVRIANNTSTLVGLDNFQLIPEPSTMALAGLALLSMAGLRRR